jgi:CHAT domain-containing protein/Flp pilus assembly protein TadD
MAQQNYELAITESKALLEEFPDYHNAYLSLALASSEAGQLEPTRAWLESLLARTPPRPMAYVGLALISNAKKDYAGAIGHYHNYLSQSPDDDRVAAMLATDYVNQKKSAAAEAYFKSLLADRPDSATGHQGLGVLYALLDRRAEALAELDHVIELQPHNVVSYYYKSVVLARAGPNPEAIDPLLICLPLLQANADDLMERMVLDKLGDLYRRSGNYARAGNTLGRVLALTRAADDLRGQERALGQLASLHYRQSNYLEALKHWRQALEVSKLISSRKLKFHTHPQRHLGGIGDVHSRLGDLAAAEQFYLKSLNLSLEAKDEPNQSSVLNGLGDLYVEQGKLIEALAIEEQALALGEKLRNVPNQLGALNSLATLHRHMGDTKQAMIYVERALKFLEGRTDPFWLTESLNNLGFLHLRSGKIPEALAAFQKTLAIDRNTTTPHVVWQAHSGAAAAYAQLGQIDKARENYQRAIEVMENVRANLGGQEEKAGYFEDKIVVYEKLINLLLDPRLNNASLQNNAEAFHYTERARARAFLDLLAEAKTDVEQNAAPDLAKRRQELQQRISQLTSQLIKERLPETNKQNKAKIAELEKGLAQADAELADWLRELRRRNSRYAALKYPEPITLSETQRMLDDQTVLLSYSLGESESFLFAVNRDDFQVKRLPAEKTLDANVQKLLAAITDKNNPAPAEYRRHSASLSQQLLQPVSRMLAGKKRLIIVADGSLHRLPFQLLFQPGIPQRGDLRQWPFLVRQFAISYAPSASVLAQLQNESRATAPKSLIAFGDPRYEPAAESAIAPTLRATSASGRLNFQPLPYSYTEIEGIAQLFAKDDRELFFREAATEENVKVPERLSSYRMVHFSTHGYVNEARPRFSGLVLSLPATGLLPANPQSQTRTPQSEDGLLAAYEIFNLKLKADLVVLSACETGLGKEVKGEGLMSLTRAFMYAGTPSVVVSLWNVNDQSAADLMIRFYRHLQAGKTKSEALRQAQLETIRDNGFPFFWAPFVLVGKP